MRCSNSIVDVLFVPLYVPGDPYSPSLPLYLPLVHTLMPPFAPSYSPSCLCNLIHAPTSSFMLHSPLSFILSQSHSYPHLCPHMVQGHKLCLFILTLAHFYTCILTHIGIPSVELMSTWLFWLWHGLTCVFSFVSTLVYFGWLSCIIV